MQRLISIALVAAVPIGVMAMRHRARRQRPIDRLRRQARRRLNRVGTMLRSSALDAAGAIAQAASR